MTPAQQLDIIRSVEAVERMDDEEVSKRDLEVSLKHKTLDVLKCPQCLQSVFSTWLADQAFTDFCSLFEPGDC